VPSLYQLAVYVVAIGFVSIALSGLASAVSGRAREFILGRIIGGIYRAITAPSKEAEAALAASQRQVEELHSALDDLGAAVFQWQGGFAEAAAARIRRYCPEARNALNSLLQRVRGPMAGYNPALMQKLLDDVRDSITPCLEIKAK
jgi:hypothetical protein